MGIYLLKTSEAQKNISTRVNAKPSPTSHKHHTKYSLRFLLPATDFSFTEGVS